MAIYSIGHDIVENKRIDDLIEKYSARFIDKILSVSEKEVFANKNDKIRFVAKRFAAKEAFAKACGIGLRDPVLMPKISISNDALGKPYFVLDSTIISFLDSHGIGTCHLSISDEINLSSAFVVLEKKHE
ncbi:MAG: holo-ACP synthase [Burkholderiales bacterium]|jgi:holo-[acyl-carrier protein] synthase|nr:holo-ACP synthase [Burkholderiales bacterium]